MVGQTARLVHKSLVYLINALVAVARCAIDHADVLTTCQVTNPIPLNTLCNLYTVKIC